MSIDNSVVHRTMRDKAAQRRSLGPRRFGQVRRCARHLFHAHRCKRAGVAYALCESCDRQPHRNQVEGDPPCP